MCTIEVMEHSLTTACLLGTNPSQALHSVLPQDPMAAYQELECKVLKALNLEHLRDVGNDSPPHSMYSQMGRDRPAAMIEGQSNGQRNSDENRNRTQSHSRWQAFDPVPQEQQPPLQWAVSALDGNQAILDEHLEEQRRQRALERNRTNQFDIMDMILEQVISLEDPDEVSSRADTQPSDRTHQLAPDSQTDDNSVCPSSDARKRRKRRRFLD